MEDFECAKESPVGRAFFENIHFPIICAVKKLAKESVVSETAEIRSIISSRPEKRSISDCMNTLFMAFIDHHETAGTIVSGGLLRKGKISMKRAVEKVVRKRLRDGVKSAFDKDVVASRLLASVLHNITHVAVYAEFHHKKGQEE